MIRMHPKNKGRRKCEEWEEGSKEGERKRGEEKEEQEVREGMKGKARRGERGRGGILKISPPIGWQKRRQTEASVCQSWRGNSSAG